MTILSLIGFIFTDYSSLYIFLFSYFCILAIELFLDVFFEIIELFHS